MRNKTLQINIHLKTHQNYSTAKKKYSLILNELGKGEIFSGWLMADDTATNTYEARKYNNMEVTEPRVKRRDNRMATAKVWK
jgi:hypothetical protein